jgi:hypothetical protein
MKKTTLAVLYGNRDFFPVELVVEARKDIEVFLWNSIPK